MVSLAYMRVRMEEPAARLLITLLDGTRDRDAIRAELQARGGRRAERRATLSATWSSWRVCSCLSRSTFC